jgi:acyl carrier protein
MTRDDLKNLALRALGDIAPEANLEALDPAEDLREQLDIDSMDFLNFVTALSQETGVDVPEIDYPRLSTLDGAIEYVGART